MTTEITKYDDVIDSRDVIARIEELEAERDGLQAEVDDAQAAVDEAQTAVNENEGIEPAAGKLADELQHAWELLGHAQSDLDDWEGAAELATLRALADEAEGYSDDWKYGATLVRDSYFETYAQELADDLGLTKDSLSWPYTCIDWEQAARELQMDYTSVEFDGVTYWVR